MQTKAQNILTEYYLVALVLSQTGCSKHRQILYLEEYIHQRIHLPTSSVHKICNFSVIIHTHIIALISLCVADENGSIQAKFERRSKDRHVRGELSSQSEP